MMKQNHNDITIRLEHYPDFVRELMRKMPRREDDLMHAAVGIAGEAGELLDQIKKHWAYGKPLDIENVSEELGDIEFYIQAMRNILVMTREDIINDNIAKLQARYPSGKFSAKDAIARADKVGK